MCHGVGTPALSAIVNGGLTAQGDVCRGAIGVLPRASRDGRDPDTPHARLPAVIGDLMPVSRPGELLCRGVGQHATHGATGSVEHPRAITIKLEDDGATVRGHRRRADQPSTFGRAVDAAIPLLEIEDDKLVFMTEGDPLSIRKPRSTPGLTIGVRAETAPLSGAERQMPQVPDPPSGPLGLNDE